MTTKRSKYGYVKTLKNEHKFAKIRQYMGRRAREIKKNTTLAKVGVNNGTQGSA